MNNQVAAPCCGSCKFFYYDEEAHSDNCHNEKATLMYKMSISHRICAGGYYTPRNPIPIIELPGVRELVKSAFGEGLHDGIEWDLDYPAPPKFQKMVSKYMKALEAK